MNAGRPILEVEESSTDGLNWSRTCLAIYADGRVLYANGWGSAPLTVETARKLRPEHVVANEYKLYEHEVSDLSHFLQSKAVQKLRQTFDSLHATVDYFESVSLKILGPRNVAKQIFVSEYYDASLAEKSSYPSALVVLMQRIREIEERARSEGKPTQVPQDCQLNLPQR